ncbi:uncharacterized protein LOC126833533 isoform X2 [Adelges cooleyi]|uniref:uncharacterized protein LOC126833533 isoform X2 n=1 Tax=Adelges cooleyi TaxID=133065 RepID=UPI00217FBE6C|nr:uncharacterized protein LOC126833533 isoform X2 [Adelges cooleyi]
MNIQKICVCVITLTTYCFGDNEEPDINQPTNEDNVEDEQIYSNHKYIDDDLIGSIQKYEPGRVQIKVYRGPDMIENGESYAPHGYWVKQPSEDY